MGGQVTGAVAVLKRLYHGCASLRRCNVAANVHINVEFCGIFGRGWQKGP